MSTKKKKVEQVDRRAIFLLETTRYTEAAERWTRSGKKILIYENRDLSSRNVGQRMMIPLGPGEPEPARGSQAPDTSVGLGWRYRLIAATNSVQEAVALMQAGLDQGED